MQFFSLNKLDVLEKLHSKESGLNSEEAKSRYDSKKKNKLQEAKKQSLLVKFFIQFKDIMVIILLIAAVISITLALVQKNYSDLFEGGVILFIVLLNATLGVIQENKAENALESLKKSTEPYCDVVRDGKITKIKTEELVPGDIVVLEAGDIVPADIRLIETHNLKADESSLTGESLAIEKNSDVVLDEHTVLSERKNMVFSSSIITYGRGKGVVVAIGTETEMGKISVLIATGKKDLTPLQKSLNKIGKYISIAVLVIAIVIFAIEMLIPKNPNILEAFLTAVALAVAAIPESLPAVVTVIMALSVQKLAGRNAIIKRLHAVETLGSCQVICSDKTGTLTQNKMTVKQLYYNREVVIKAESNDTTNRQFKELINCMVLCNDSSINKKVAIGDPTETALINFAYSCGIDANKLIEENKRIYEIPFDSNRKLMTTVNATRNGTISYTKGASDVLIKKCSHIMVGGRIEVLTSEHLKMIDDAINKMGEDALRVLALAYKTHENFTPNSACESNLTFLGLVGMIDPPRIEAIDAIKKCFNASLKPIMITGDHMSTAFAVAKELGIASKKSQVITGDILNKISDTELVNIINKYSVFARVSPEHKVRIVKAYKKLGKVVAMTGDGVNDAPSLKIADIGIGMGITGTDVTKDVADMIISDDNFATIIIAVEEGRKIYSNIQKTIQFLISTNAVEVFTLFLTCLFMPQFVFLLPSQLLFINFITDSLPAIALGLEPAEFDIMERPPRENSSNILSEGVWARILYQAAIQIVIVMIIYSVSLNYWGNLTATTMAFFTINLMQLFHSVNLKTKHSIFEINIFKNKMFNFSFLIGLSLIILVATVPFIRSVFSIGVLSLTQWIIVILASISIIPLVEFAKYLVRKFAWERIK